MGRTTMPPRVVRTLALAPLSASTGISPLPLVRDLGMTLSIGVLLAALFGVLARGLIVEAGDLASAEAPAASEEAADLAALHAAGGLGVRVRLYYRVHESPLSLDWLLGLSQDEGIIGSLNSSIEIEETQEGADGRTLMVKWHAEAAGTKELAAGA